MSGNNFETTFDTPMRSNFAPKSYPRVMSRHNFHTACTLPILPQKLSRRCTHAQTPRRNVMAYIRHVRGWKRASMARALPWAGIPCSPCTVVTRPKILVALLPLARGRGFPSPFTVGTRATIPVALYRGHEAEDSRRPFTTGPEPKIPVALYSGHEAEDPRRPLPWARG